MFSDNGIHNRIDQRKFYHENPSLIVDTDIDKILIPSKDYLDKKDYKYFIGYKGVIEKIIHSLCKMLPEMIDYVNMMGKLIQNFMMMKYLKKVPIVFVCL